MKEGQRISPFLKALGDSMLLPKYQQIAEVAASQETSDAADTIQVEFTGQEVARRRHELAMSQRELARRTGTSQNQIYYIESGKTEMNRNTREKTARALGGEARTIIEYPTS